MFNTWGFWLGLPWQTVVFEVWWAVYFRTDRSKSYFLWKTRSRKSLSSWCTCLICKSRECNFERNYPISQVCAKDVYPSQITVYQERSYRFWLIRRVSVSASLLLFLSLWLHLSLSFPLSIFTSSSFLSVSVSL